MLIVCLIILFDKAFLLILKNGTLRDGSVVKSTICPSRGPGLDSQYPHVCNSFQGVLLTSWAPDTHTQTHCLQNTSKIHYRIQAKYPYALKNNKKYNYLKMNFYFLQIHSSLYTLYMNSQSIYTLYIEYLSTFSKM